MSRQQIVKTQDNDPGVALPAAIRAAAARSDALHKQTYQTEEQPQGEPEGQEPQPQAPAEPPAQPQPEAQPPAAQAPAEPPAQPQGGENFEHMYRSLKGRYDQQERVINGLRQRVTELEARPAAPAAPPKPRDPDLQFKPLTPEERESYGEDFIDVAARAAAERFVPTINSLRGELERVTGQLTESQRAQGMTAQQMLNATMDREVPNWREINRDRNFLAWLDLQDDFSGATRIGMLKDAYAKGDASRVAAFFKGFLAHEAAKDPANQPAPPAQPGKPKLETFAAPGRAKAPAAAPAPGQKETISRSQITNFYKLVNSGHYRGNEAEKERLEQMIFDAEKEGRIID